jgi:uncharacterized membrane protein
LDLATTTLFLVIGALATNQLVMRAESMRQHSSVFWGLQGMNAAFGGYVLWFGLPGFRHVPPVGWVVGLLFLTHAAQNIRIYTSMQRHDEEDTRAAARAAELRERLTED